jgi:hypothetical protein
MYDKLKNNKYNINSLYFIWVIYLIFLIMM